LTFAGVYFDFLSVPESRILSKISEIFQGLSSWTGLPMQEVVTSSCTYLQLPWCWDANCNAVGPFLAAGGGYPTDIADRSVYLCIVCDNVSVRQSTWFVGTCWKSQRSNTKGLHFTFLL